MVGLGALGGAVTALVTEGMGFFKRSQEHKQEVKLLEMQMVVGKQETEKEEYVASVQQFGSSLVSAREHDMSLNEGISLWVKNLRASFRPIAGYSSYLFVFALACFGSNNEIKADAAASIYLIVEAVTAFYFVNRMLSKTSK